MIQRIQSIFLLLIVALSAALFYFPVFIATTTTANFTMREAPFAIQSNVLISLTVVISGLIAFVTIFIYKKRQRQMMLCRLNMLFIIASLGLMLQASDMSSLPLSKDIVTIHYLFAIYFPIAQIAFNWLAIRYIKKDDDLVRSADRLR
jgi:hypothetical protein